MPRRRHVDSESPPSTPLDACARLSGARPLVAHAGWNAPLLAAVLVALSAAPAYAAACCLSSSAFGVGRLARWEQFAVIVGTSTSPVAGRWDEQGAWHVNMPGYSENEWRAQLSALGAVHPRLQLSGRAPLLLTQKSSGDQHEVSGGLGDSQLAVRYEPIYQGEYEYVPEVALTAGMTVPIGRTAGVSKTILGSDVTSRGAWVPSASVTTELARNFWFVQLGGGVTFPLPMAGAEPGTTQQFGLGWQATIAGGAEVTKGVVLSLVGRYAYEGPLRVDGQPLMQSQAWDFGGALNAAWKFGSHWTLQGGADVGLFASGLGANRQGRFTGSLAVRYAYF